MKSASIRPLFLRVALVACFFVLSSLFVSPPLAAQEIPAEPLTPLLPTWSALNRPDWTPDPALIVAAQAERETTAANAEEGAANPTWVRTAFVSYRDGNAEVYSADSNGRNQVRLTATGQAEARPRVSIDGAWVAYDVDYYGTGGREILRVPFGGGTPEIIVDSPDPTVRDMAPAWSPDGKYLAFVSTRDGNAEIYLLILETMQLWRVTYNGLADFDPSWNPATGELVWVRQMDSVYGVVMTAFIGGGERRVSDYIPHLETPFYDATGTMLAYTSSEGWGALSNVFVRYGEMVDQVTMGDAVPYDMRMLFRLDAFYTQTVLDSIYFPNSLMPMRHLFITRYIVRNYGGVRYLVEANLTSPGLSLGDGPTMDGDAVVLDQIAPEMAIAMPPGQMNHRDPAPPILATDKGGSGIAGVEFTYTSEKFDQMYPEFFVPPAPPPHISDSACGSATFSAQATDGAGRKSALATVSTILVGSTRSISMREVGGAPIKGAAVSTYETQASDGVYNPFGTQYSDAAGIVHYRTCSDNGEWFWPPSTVWERFDPSERFGGDEQVLLSKKGQVALHKEFPTPGVASTADATTSTNAPVAQTDDRILIYRATATVDPAKVSENLWLALWYNTASAPQSPMQITLQSADAITPTLLLEKRPLAGSYEYLYLPLGSNLSGPITLTVSIAAREGVDGSAISINDARIASQWLPIVDQVTAIETAGAFELDATRAYTVTGDNFMQPLTLKLGEVDATIVEWVDAQALRATFPSALPPGMLALVVTNRAGSANAASTQLSNAVASQVRAFMPIVQWRATPIH